MIAIALRIVTAAGALVLAHKLGKKSAAIRAAAVRDLRKARHEVDEIVLKCQSVEVEDLSSIDFTISSIDNITNFKPGVAISYSMFEELRCEMEKAFLRLQRLVLNGEAVTTPTHGYIIATRCEAALGWIARIRVVGGNDDRVRADKTNLRDRVFNVQLNMEDLVGDEVN